MKMKFYRTFILLFSFLAAIILSCGTVSAKDNKIELVYVEWADAVAATHVVEAVLTDKLGYDVETISVSAAAMWQSVASGDSDAMVAAWLPATHEHYYEELKTKVDNLGPNLEGTRIGLVVPSYVTIDSIDELDENADKFNGQIVGIDPGAGIMSTTEKAVDAYNLEEIELIESSGATMTAMLGNRIQQEKWVVVTGWTPHWKFARWDLKYLEDPEGVYGGEEHIATIARQGLKEEMPDAYAFLDNFKWTPEDVAEVMVWNLEEDASPAENAQRYIRENPEKIKQWLKGI